MCVFVRPHALNLQYVYYIVASICFWDTSSRSRPPLTMLFHIDIDIDMSQKRIGDDKTIALILSSRHVSSVCALFALSHLKMMSINVSIDACL